MNRLQDCFDDDADADDDVSAGPLFQGMWHDPSMPLTDFAARDFSPALKPWMNQEPLGYVDGLNVYAAPVDEPVNPINPLGTKPPAPTVAAPIAANIHKNQISYQ